jgi:hypothetical protein
MPLLFGISGPRRGIPFAQWLDDCGPRANASSGSFAEKVLLGDRPAAACYTGHRSPRVRAHRLQQAVTALPLEPVMNLSDGLW